MLSEVFRQRYERGLILETINLPFNDWTELFRSEGLKGALLDRLTHQVHILEMSYYRCHFVSLSLVWSYHFKEWIGVRQTATAWGT